MITRGLGTDSNYVLITRGLGGYREPIPSLYSFIIEDLQRQSEKIDQNRMHISESITSDDIIQNIDENYCEISIVIRNINDSKRNKYIESDIEKNIIENEKSKTLEKPMDDVEILSKKENKTLLEKKKINDLEGKI